MKPVLLAVTAHPDDESFGPGGTIARYARRGARVVLVSATRGEAGKAGDPPLCSREELPRVREEELRRAARVLGIERVEFLDYRDKELEQADPEEVTAKILRVMGEEAPRAIITMPPGGISGHRDHQVISRLTTLAFFRRREATAGAGAGPQGLYYWTIPAQRVKAIRGRGPAHPLDVARTTVIDVADTVDVKVEAIRCHRTQHLSVERVFHGFPPSVRRALSKEYFYRYYPPFDSPAPVEGELFPLSAPVISQNPEPIG